MKGTVFLLLALLSSLSLSAYNYGEHKEIGDRAFARFMETLSRSSLSGRFLQYLGGKKDSLTGMYYFPELSLNDRLRVSYGVLNALSGDHESNPLALEEQLRYRSSVMSRIMDLHELYIAAGYTAAPDGKLSKVDFRYALQAAVNLSHFYEYNRSFQEQLRHFDKKLIKKCQEPDEVNTIFKKLGHTNAVNMYVTLHALAIDLAEQSGRLAATGKDTTAQQLFWYAILFNAFADHFLEDAFSAGHLVVNRTIMASITNNKALHDFYSRNGATVLNRNGQIWKAYGDGQFNSSHGLWQQAGSLQQIRYDTYTPEAERIISAVTLSLNDISTAFERGYNQKGYTPFLQRIPDNRKQQGIYLLNHIASLRLVPIPYNSDLRTLFPQDTIITKAMKKANATLPYRNFIRSRVANSFVFSIMRSFADEDHLQGPEFRINANNFMSRFEYNRKGGKKGMLDMWHGYTISYGIVDLHSREKPFGRPPRVQLVKAGIRSNFDYWITDTRFLGLYSYLEAGAQFSRSTTTFIVEPSLGIQLASLFNINYHNMPVWLRIPAEYFLPLKFRYGMLVDSKDSPKYFTAIDLDILF